MRMTRIIPGVIGLSIALIVFGWAVGTRSARGQTPLYNLSASAVLGAGGTITLTNSVTDLGGGSFQAVQWNTDYDETLVSFVSFSASCGTNLSAENDDGSRVLTGCISFAGDTIAPNTVTYTATFTCIAPGDAAFTLTGTDFSTSPDTFIAKTSGNQPISTTDSTVTCPGTGPTATNTSVPPTATNTSAPPTATNTPVPPTATATNTSVPPTATNTSVPPTATNTSVPPTATNTPVGPTATATNTSVAPTATNTSVPPTATNTSVPPTATNTPVGPTATATNTPAGPTATNTSVPPTATNTSVPPTATNTSVPPTATSTSVPTATATPAPGGECVPLGQKLSIAINIVLRSGATTGSVFYRTRYDLNGDGVINAVDLGIVMSRQECHGTFPPVPFLVN